uniref:PPUP8751 n=1 Tax=Poeciliopsis prolifica TaxID=188132 RepID=A0A0S7EK45_9TELE
MFISANDSKLGKKIISKLYTGLENLKKSKTTWIKLRCKLWAGELEERCGNSGEHLVPFPGDDGGKVGQWSGSLPCGLLAGSKEPYGPGSGVDVPLTEVLYMGTAMEVNNSS